jgi:hypothetical protein
MFKVLTPKLDWIAEIDDFISLQFKRKWNDIGQFELHINRNSSGVEELKKDRLIMLSPNKVGIIKHREVEVSEDGKSTENWVFKGYDLKGVLGQRITLPPETTSHDNKSGDAETVLKHYVERNAINPQDRNRKFVLLKSNENLNRGTHINWQSRYKNLAEEIRDISLESDLGWDVFLDLENGWWVFDTFEGNDLTAENSQGNSPVFFSPEFGNVSGMSYSDSDLDLRNVAFVGGQGEGVLREIVELGNSTDYERIETFIDARDVNPEGEGSNGESLSERGERILSQMNNQQHFSAEILTPIKKTIYDYDHHGFLSPSLTSGDQIKKSVLYSTFFYEKDWNLGDIVTVFNRDWNVMSDQRITEINEIYEGNNENFRLEATFGQSRPTLISKLKYSLSKFDNELKK